MQFKEKLEKLAEENRKLTQSLENKKQIWINELKNLYSQIEQWFGEYIERGLVSIDYTDLDSAECIEFFEKTRIMEISLGGGPSVILEPTGINIVGAFGKIDLYQRGHKDEKIFLLLVENKENSEIMHWELYKGKGQQDRVVFDKETFENLLNEWLENWTDI